MTAGNIPTPIAWTSDHAIRILDQTLLPQEERYVELHTLEEVAEAIRSLRVRGAPLIGIAAAMGVAMAVGQGDSGAAGKRESGKVGQGGLGTVRRACALLEATRPTAVNLHWALRRMERRAETAANASEPLDLALQAEANAIWEEDRAMCERIGSLGATLISRGGTLATICNAGALATGGMGTALAPMYTLHDQGVPLQVLVPETRPLLQGSRLTAWELSRAGIPVTLMADSMLASRLRRGDVQAVLVGADRIAANGDVANKIGTYGLALVARAHGVPFYVAAPTSTVDPLTPDGASIPIEERSSEELMRFGERRMAPGGVSVWNPAFDVTPAALVTAIVTDQGIFSPAEISLSLPLTSHLAH